MQRPLAVLPAVLLLLAGLAACQGSETPAEPGAPGSVAPAVEGKVVVLSSRDEQFLRPLLGVLAERLPGVELVVDYGKDTAYLDRLRAEKGAPRADLFLSKSAGAMEAAAADGLLAPLPEALLSRVPERFRGSGGSWVGLSARARVVVARRLLANKPLSMLDLGDPRWKGRVARTTATNDSFVGGVAAALADHGRTRTLRFLDGLATNTEDGALVFPKHTPTVAAVMEGKADLALVNHYYYYRAVLGKQVDEKLTRTQADQKVAESAVEVVFPDRDGTGVPWNVTGGALVAGSPNGEAAAAVLEVLLSDEGQRAYAWANREYPVVDKVPSPPGVAPAASFKWSDTGIPRLAEAHAEAVELIRAVGLD